MGKLVAVSGRRMAAATIALAVLGSIRVPAGEFDPKAPLPADPNVRYAALPNGMQYWIRAHKTPPGKVTMWLRIGSGSINEEDNQRGLAHFIEHLAFDGSENFPPGTLVKYFESIGLRFGHHQNAFTGFDQTTYTITMPDTKDETVGKGLLCLSDFAYRMGLTPDEIEKERAVILEEERARKGAHQRIFDRQLPILLPGSRVAERMPIGKPEVIKAADRKAFLDYYAKWYRPDDALLLIAGDIDPAAVEKLVVEKFKDWKPAANPAADADPGVKPYSSIRAAVFADPELTETDVSVVSIRPLHRTLTVGDFRARLIEDIGCWVVDRRLDEMVQKGTAPFQNAGVGISPFLNVATYISGSATGQPDKWAPMMESLLTEIKRMRDHGILAQEFEDARKDFLATAEQRARTEPTRDAQNFVSRMHRFAGEGRKPMSEAQRLELVAAVLPTLTAEEVSAAFKAAFAADARLLLIKMPEKEGVKAPTQEEALALAAKVEASAVEPPAAKERPKSLMEKDPDPGEIAEQAEDPDLKILSVTFANGARVHLRRMDFKKDLVLVRITVAGGGIRENDGNRGVTEAAALALRQPATDALPSTVIRDLMTGKKVGVGGGAQEDALIVSISGLPKDIEDGFRLAHLLLTRGRIEGSALKVWKQQKLQEIEAARMSVEAQAEERAAALVSGGDPRMRSLKAEDVERATLERAQAWLDGIFRNGPIEAAIVGDMDRSQALALAAKYIGSLPKRERSDPGLSELRKLKQDAGPLEAAPEVETITPRATVIAGWRGCDWTDVKERRILNLASQVMSSRLREEIREKRGLTYSISGFFRPSKAYSGAGFFGSYMTADPDKADDSARLTRELMEKFAKEGPTDAEMDAVRKQFRNMLETTLKEPGYWADVLADLDYHRTNLSDVKEVLDKMTSYTREDVMAVLRKYVVEDRRMQVVAKPKKKAEQR